MTNGDYLEIELPLAGGWRLNGKCCWPAATASYCWPTRCSLLHRNREKTGRRLERLIPKPLLPRSRRSCATLLAGTGCWGRLPPGCRNTRGLVRNRRPARHLASVIPLALPEWRAEFLLCGARFGGRSPEAGAKSAGLQFVCAAVDRPRFSPAAAAADAQVKITVAETLAAVTRDVATAFRVQVGARQWVVYRSLAKCGNRTSWVTIRTTIVVPPVPSRPAPDRSGGCEIE